MSRKEKQEERFKMMSEFELKLWNDGMDLLVGIDEVGRGPLAGPVVAAAVILPTNFYLPEINDSKKLSEKKRNELFDIIKKEAICYAIASVDEKKIDEINILESTKLAMKSAIYSIKEKVSKKFNGDKSIDYLLIDAVKLEDIDIPQMNIVKGDARSISIAAASILAKVTRDRLMIRYNEQYPGYSFNSNKGYGTKQHYEGISKLGITPIHRKSFLKNIL